MKNTRKNWASKLVVDSPKRIAAMQNEDFSQNQHKKFEISEFFPIFPEFLSLNSFLNLSVSSLSPPRQRLQCLWTSFILFRPAPRPYVQGQLESAQFYLMKVLKDKKDATNKEDHRSFVRLAKDLLSGLEVYIKNHHMTGVEYKGKVWYWIMVSSSWRRFQTFQCLFRLHLVQFLLSFHNFQNLLFLHRLQRLKHLQKLAVSVPFSLISIKAVKSQKD